MTPEKKIKVNVKIAHFALVSGFWFGFHPKLFPR